jgi:DNA-binding transcriptional LysR family regulator
MDRIERMDLAGFDLNLLLVFDALMRDRNVTRAGARIGLSQPAVSAALARLRHALDDELFVRAQGGMVPTPRALALAEPIRAALDRVAEAVAKGRAFDPASSRAVFTLMCPDYFQLVLVPALVARLRRCAPGISLRVLDASRGPIAALLEQGECDFAADLAGDQPGDVRTAFLLQERYVFVAAERHREIDAAGLAPEVALDLDLYCRLPHVLRSVSGDADGVVDAALSAIGRRRDVVSTLPHFVAVARAAAESDLVASLPERLARVLAPRFALAVRPLPVTLAPLNLLLYWHARRDRDPAHAWMRDQLVGVAGELAGDR